MSSKDGFVRLVRLAAQTLYSDIQVGSTGDIIDVVGVLTRHHWIREKDLAKELNMDKKRLEPILRFLQEENFIRREIPQKLKRQKTSSCATTVANSERLVVTMDRREPIKIHSNSHCCLDYAKVYHAVKIRIREMTENLKNKLNIQDIVEQYSCTHCEISYSALDAVQLASPIDDYFHCEKCNKKLVVEDRGEIQKQSLSMLQKLEGDLRPLSSLLHELEGVTIPTFISLQEWRGRIIYENADVVTPVSLVQDTNIETSIVPIVGHKRLKDLVPWIIKGEGSNLTPEQMELLSSKYSSNRQVGLKSKRDSSI